MSQTKLLARMLQALVARPEPNRSEFCRSQQMSIGITDSYILQLVPVNHRHDLLLARDKRLRQIRQRLQNHRAIAQRAKRQLPNHMRMGHHPI